MSTTTEKKNYWCALREEILMAAKIVGIQNFGCQILTLKKKEERFNFWGGQKSLENKIVIKIIKKILGRCKDRYLKE